MVIALTILHVLMACFLILVVLVQTGKGSDIGAAFGGGASQTVFGARGAATVLQKITSGLAVGFMATSLILAVLAGTYRGGRSIIPDEPPRAAPQTSSPAVPPAGAPAGEQKAPPPAGQPAPSAGGQASPPPEPAKR